MAKFAANLTMLFTEVPFLERFEKAHQAGFKAVEYLFPYAFEAEELSEKMQKFGFEQALFNMPPGDWDAGERGFAAIIVVKMNSKPVSTTRLCMPKL